MHGFPAGKRGDEAVLNFVIGLLLGGCTVGMILCGMQLNRISRYEQEIRRLNEKLNSMD